LQELFVFVVRNVGGDLFHGEKSRGASWAKTARERPCRRIPSRSLGKIMDVVFLPLKKIGGVEGAVA
jgi:hypothetical protein